MGQVSKLFLLDKLCNYVVISQVITEVTVTKLTLCKRKSLYQLSIRSKILDNVRHMQGDKNWQNTGNVEQRPSITYRRRPYAETCCRRQKMIAKLSQNQQSEMK